MTFSFLISPSLHYHQTHKTAKTKSSSIGTHSPPCAVGACPFTTRHSSCSSSLRRSPHTRTPSFHLLPTLCPSATWSSRLSRQQWQQQQQRCVYIYICPADTRARGCVCQHHLIYYPPHTHKYSPLLPFPYFTRSIYKENKTSLRSYCLSW